jgi:hypothetical protein
MNRPGYWLTNWRLLLVVFGLLLGLNLVGLAVDYRRQQHFQDWGEKQ